ncbi:MAG: SIS domain-containing protein [Acidimicrobiia bacterium]|nr:SIS domain-containing protein [Acidimicrobiia bacterium]
MSQMQGRWLAAARSVLDRIEATQMSAIAEVAELCAHAIAGGGMAHLFGTGHSRIPLEEMFPRYGSYPGFHPIAELSMTFHTQITGANGQRQAMFIERVEGLAEIILRNFDFQHPDLMIVFSASGVTAVPIEIAAGSRERGMKVVAVTAVEHSMAADPHESSGSRLLDHADVVIDMCIPIGDSAVLLDDIDTPVGPVSTVANAAIVNELKVQTAALLADRGQLPPVLTSASVVGTERSAALFEAAYEEHAKRLARALGGRE